MPVALRNQQRLHPAAAARLKTLAQRALGRLGNRQANLSLVLVGDAVIRELNREFHQTDAPTDVLSFDYGAGELEVIVNVERAARVAKRYGNTPSREWALYVIHGILHLHGFDDRTALARRAMRRAERRFLQELAA
jgi:probable rRNA maturation factor